MAEVLVASGPFEVGQNVYARRAVKVGPVVLRLVADVDSSYPHQSRIYTEHLRMNGWANLWRYLPGDFDELPIARLPESRRVENVVKVEKMFDRMIEDALAILGGN